MNVKAAVPDLLQRVPLQAWSCCIRSCTMCCSMAVMTSYSMIWAACVSGWLHCEALLEHVAQCRALRQQTSTCLLVSQHSLLRLPECCDLLLL